MRTARLPLLLSMAVFHCGIPNCAGAQDLAEVAAPGANSNVQQQVDAAQRQQALLDRDAYQRRITEIEARAGVYGVELSEAYVGLGTTLRTLEDHDAAADAFGKALQALRIAHGLTDMRQLPVLAEVIATNERRGAWDEVNAARHLVFDIAKHNAATGEDLRVKALLDLGRWLRQATAQKLIADPDARPGAVSELYANEIERLEALQPYAGKNVHLASLQLERASTELDEAHRKYALPITAFQAPGGGSEQRSTITQQCFTFVDRNGRAGQVCNQAIETPNMNYYLAPNQQKNLEIRGHLAAVENSVLAAFRLLQDEPAPEQVQTQLLSDVHRITAEYNAFLQTNRDDADPLK